MLSNYTFLETKIQRLLDGSFFRKATWRAHAQNESGLCTGRNLKHNIWKKGEGKLRILFIS